MGIGDENMYDVAIIGAGVVGSACARVLSRYRLSVALVEAAADVAMGASRANSAIVHAGYDCEPGTLMARFNVAGNALYDQWCSQLDVPLMRCGSFVLAFDEQDEKQLEKLLDYGRQNGVPELSIIPGSQALEMEPNLNPQVRSVLWAKTGGITCPYEMTQACAENAAANGVTILTDFKVVQIDSGETFTLKSARGQSIAARYLVNAAGLYADEISGMAGGEPFTITPRQGEYMLMDKTAGQVVHTVIFQTPSKMGKGILVSPTVDGNLFAGPTARDTDDKTDTSTTAQGMAEIQRFARKSVPDIPLNRVITAFTGIRATPHPHDFIIGVSKLQPRLIQCAGICSPGLTSAPAIAENLPALCRQAGLELVEKDDYNPTRAHIARFARMTPAQREAAIAQDPRYGRVICRCETITEAEIVQAIARGARTLDGVKRRCRAGMGRCQGGFCAPRVMEIISRETGIPMTELTKFGGGSRLLAGGIKEELK